MDSLKMKKYLIESNDIQNQEKKFTMDFCKKTEYLNGLRDTVVNQIHTTVTTGYGSVNSKICFVFSDENSFQFLKPIIQNILEKFHLNIWDVYITFINKTSVDYQAKYAYLINEIYAVRPQILYVIDVNESTYNTINKAFEAMKIPNPTEKFYHVPVKELYSTDEEDKKKLWNIFKFLINYRN